MRTGIAAVVSLAVAATPSAASNLDADFLIKRKDKVIGYHSVDVTETAQGIEVETRVEMKVKFGPISLFHFTHASTELWRGGELVALESTTDENGKYDTVRIWRENGATMVDGTEFQGAAPVGSAPTSYWTKSIIDAPALISTQTGEIIDIEVTSFGRTTAEGRIHAEHYQLVGTLALNLWYDGEQWVGKNITIDGEELTYELVAKRRDYAASSEFLD